MPPEIAHPIPGCIGGVMRMQNVNTGQTVINTYHWHSTSLTVPTAAVDAAAAFMATQLWPIVRGSLTSGTKLVDCTAKDESIVPGYTATNNSNSGQVGTSGTNPLPANTALAVSWRTAVGGRSGRGRDFYGPFDEAGVTNDTINSGLVASLFQIGAYLLGNNPYSGFKFAVRSLTDAIARDVTGFVIETTIDTMKKRLLNHGI